MRAWIAGLVLFCMALVASNGYAASAELYPELAQARHAGWDTARKISGGIGAGDLRRFPGVQAWLKEFRALDLKFDAKTANAQPPAFDFDRLIARNPAWWRAVFEISPADPPVMLLEAGLLLAAGEASRASYLLVVARQRPGIPDAMRDAIASLLVLSQRALARAGQDILAAGQQVDAGGLAPATTKLRAVLSTWPQNALANFELGLAGLAQQYVTAGKKPPPRSTLSFHSDLKPSADVLAFFARARLHDPLLVPAYRSTEQPVADAVIVLGREVRIYWEAVAKDSAGEAPDDVLRLLAGGLQKAGLHDLAIATRQVIIARERGYDDADRRFLVTSLRRLISEQAADAVTQRVLVPRNDYLSIILQP